MFHYISNIQSNKNAVNRVHEAIKTLPEEFQRWFFIFRAPMPQTFHIGDTYDWKVAKEGGLWSIACLPSTPREILDQFTNAWLSPRLD